MHLNPVSLSSNRNLPSIFRSLSKINYDTDPTEAFASLGLGSNPRTTPSVGARLYAGPGPPKSWIRTAGQDVQDTPEWREEALSLIFSRIHDAPSNRFNRSEQQKQLSVPSLTLVCLRRLLSLTSSSEFIQHVVPYLPSHLRRDLVRDAAVHSPLPSSSLFSLFGREGHVSGELLIVGPAASLPEGYLLRNSPTTGHNTAETSSSGGAGGDQAGDWEAEGDTPDFLSTFILLSTPLSSSALLRLPLTITDMALVHLPCSIPLHRLPGICPLLEVLDLSFNAWLAEGSQDGQKILNSVDWRRWNYLRILGLRGCYVPDGMIVKLNKGRWDDVHVIQ